MFTAHDEQCLPGCKRRGDHRTRAGRTQHDATCDPSCERGGDHRRRKRKASSKGPRDLAAIDGEAWRVDKRMTLLGTSIGAYLEDVDGLESLQIFRWLTRQLPWGFQWVGYAFDWDVNMILADVPRNRLEELREQNRFRWRGYEVRYIPRKVFSVQDLNKSSRYFRSEDIFGFFGSSFITAYEGFVGKPVSESTKAGKAQRGDIGQMTLAEVRAYNEVETQEIAELATVVRERFHAQGIKVRKMHGPGAVADHVLGKLKAQEQIAPHAYLGDVPARAYFGGRIDAARAGTIAGPLHSYDIASAYPAAMRTCPDLTKLRWSRSATWNGDDYSLVHVSWSVRCPKTDDDGYPINRSLRKPFWGPLPWRDRSGAVRWPPIGEGWYWGVEVAAAMQRFPKGAIKVIESYNLSATSELAFPFAQIIENMFRRRQRLSKEHGWPLKVALNSLYGKTAQHVGAMRYTSVLWAGWITAATRARLSLALLACPDAVLVMTDSILSPSPMETGEGLGAWTHEATYSAVHVAQAGVLVYEKDGALFSSRARGFSGQTPTQMLQLISAADTGLEARVTQRRFVTLGQAFALNDLERWRGWETSERALHSMRRWPTSKRTIGDARGFTYPRMILEKEQALSHPYKPVTDWIDDGEGEAYTD